MDKTKAHRNSTWRSRKLRDVIVAPVELEAGAFTAALVRKGVVEANRSVSREEIAAHAGAIIALWTKDQT